MATSKKKKKNKYDVVVKADMSFEQLMKLAATTPLKNSKVKKQKKK